MKLLLTSGGIANQSLEKELKRLIGKELAGLKMLFCTTAANYDDEGGVSVDGNDIKAVSEGQWFEV
jgi:hypothetical protein